MSLYLWSSSVKGPSISWQLFEHAIKILADIDALAYKILACKYIIKSYY